MAGTKQCPSCGSTNHDQAAFCAGCGAKYPVMPSVVRAPRKSWDALKWAALGIAGLIMLAGVVSLIMMSSLERSLLNVRPGMSKDVVVQRLGTPRSCRFIETGVEGCLWAERPNDRQDLGLGVRVIFVDGHVDSIATSRSDGQGRSDWEEVKR